MADTLVTVELKTSLGSITLELNQTKAPESVANFVNYARAGHYDDTIFHRVIDGFMIQGGGFGSDGVQKPTGEGIYNEAANGLTNDRGTVAMARTSQPHSASAQFFINVKDNSFLNYPGQDGWGYAVFGRVSQGMEVVDRIKAVRTGRRPLKMRAAGRVIEDMSSDVPLEPVVLQSATVLA